MKKLLLIAALAMASPFAWGQVSGTITEFTPGSVIVLKESNGPMRYHFGKTVTYVTSSGTVLDEDAVRTRIKVGVPVRVHVEGTGDNQMVDRVILEDKDED